MRDRSSHLLFVPVVLRGRPATSARCSTGEPTTSRPGRPRMLSSQDSGGVRAWARRAAARLGPARARSRPRVPHRWRTRSSATSMTHSASAKPTQAQRVWNSLSSISLTSAQSARPTPRIAVITAVGQPRIESRGQRTGQELPDEDRDREERGVDAEVRALVAGRPAADLRRPESAVADADALSTGASIATRNASARDDDQLRAERPVPEAPHGAGSLRGSYGPGRSAAPFPDQAVQDSRRSADYRLGRHHERDRRTAGVAHHVSVRDPGDAARAGEGGGRQGRRRPGPGGRAPADRRHGARPRPARRPSGHREDAPRTRDRVRARAPTSTASSSRRTRRRRSSSARTSPARARRSSSRGRSSRTSCSRTRSTGRRRAPRPRCSRRWPSGASRSRAACTACPIRSS